MKLFDPFFSQFSYLKRFSRAWITLLRNCGLHCLYLCWHIPSIFGVEVVGKKGSHFHPHRDLFVPNERKDVITSTICWTAVVSLLAGLSFVMGPVQLLKLYVIPYLLVGVTAMLLVCKYEEGYVPVVDDLIMIFDKAYSRKEILDMEKLMVNTLQFNLSVPTSYVFMRRFLKSGQSDKKLELLSFFKIELCLVECEMLRFPPSLLAAAAVLKAQCTLNGRRECAKLMVIFHQKAGTGKLTGVYT